MSRAVLESHPPDGELGRKGDQLRGGEEWYLGASQFRRRLVSGGFIFHRVPEQRTAMDYVVRVMCGPVQGRSGQGETESGKRPGGYLLNAWGEGGNCSPAWAPDGSYIIHTERTGSRPVRSPARLGGAQSGPLMSRYCSVSGRTLISDGLESADKMVKQLSRISGPGALPKFLAYSWQIMSRTPPAILTRSMFSASLSCSCNGMYVASNTI